ncbi:MAG: PLP-dependent aminotransferase family protein [Ruthenibacterium sp.]
MQSLTLRFTADEPLYHQLYARLADDMRAGRLAAGEKLPSKRRLAEQLRISLNTVDTAYQMLVAEGYLAARPRSGYVVCSLEQPMPFAVQRAGCHEQTDTAPRAKGADAGAADADLSRANFDAALGAVSAARYHFETAAIDTTLFPFKAWRRLQRDLLAGDPSLLNHGHRQGDENLRRAIATYLHEFRGAQCTAEQVVVGAGIEYLLGLLARLFAGRTFAVEDPGYARTHRILENSGANVAFVPVDSEGMTVDALRASGAQLAYVTPSHQFPTGVTMPVGRRTALLHWAAQAPQRYLIEDDYDSEFRFDGKPLPALQGLDDGTHVIYISTFSKSIAPAIRIGYMVLPPALLLRYREEFGFYSSTVSRFEQQTLCRFMDEGYFARHLARLRIAYRQRRDALVAALQSALGPGAKIYGSHTGLHLLLQMDGGMTQAQLVAAAAQCGVHLTGLSDYYASAKTRAACPPATVVLGYAALPLAEIANAADALRTAWKKP